tara:strand:+ start:375 stop:551 length:177 start_codon:yes stop_codon:yes gene_type:complete
VNNGPGIISVKQRPQQGIQVKILAEMLQVLIRIEAALTADGEAVSAEEDEHATARAKG